MNLFFDSKKFTIKLTKKKLSRLSNNMSHQCGRCFQTFSSEQYLALHWKKKYPCDGCCTECGIQIPSEKAFIKHVKSNCKYIPRNNETNLEKVFETKKVIPNPQKKQIPKTINDYVKELKESDNMYELIPHGEELEKIDREKVFGRMAPKVVEVLVDSIHGAERWVSSVEIDRVVYSTLKQMYCIDRFPETINVYMTQRKEGEEQFYYYDGEEFVRDRGKYSKRVFHLFYSAFEIVKWMVKISDQPDDIKQLLTEKLNYSKKNNYNDINCYLLQRTLPKLITVMVNNKERIFDTLKEIA